MARSFDDYLKERKQYGPPRAVNSFDDYLSIRKEEEEESQHYGVDVPNFLFDEYNSLANKYNNINNGVYISPNGAEELQNQLDFQQNIWDTYRNYYTQTGYGTEWMGDYGKNFDVLREGIGTAAERYASYKDAGDYYRGLMAPTEEEQTAFPGAPYHPNYYNQIKGTPESLDATLDSEYWKRDHEEPIEPAGAPSSNKLPLPEGTRKSARNVMSATDVRYVNPDLLKAMAGGYTPGTIPEMMLHPDLQGAGLKIPLQTPYAKSETNSPLPSPTIKWDYFRKTQKENISKYGNPKYALPYMSESELVGALEAERKAIGGKESKTTKAMDDWYSVNYIKGAEKRYDDLGRRIDEAKASLSGAVQDYTLLETQAREYAGAGELELSDQAFARSQSKLEEQYAAERALNLLEGEREFFRQRQLELRVAEKASRVLKDPSFTFDGAQYDPAKSVFEVIGMSPGARLYYTEIEGMAKSLDSDAERKQALSALAYEYINNRGAINMDIDPKGWDRMSPDEKLIFNTLHNQDNFDEALKFLEEFKEVFLFRRQAANTEEWAEYAKDQPVWAWLMSGGQYMVNALMTPFQLLSDTPYSPLFDPLVANQTIQATQSKMAGEALSSPVLGRPLGSFLYDTLSTVRDVGAAIGLGAMTGNYALTQYLMSSNAASSTYRDALLTNTDRGTAAILAIGAGAVEWVTERFSIDVLMSKSQAKNALIYWAKNFFAEASEEGASKLANLILDNYLRGSSGEYGQMWQSIKNENPGWTDAKVTNAANAQWRQDLTAETIVGGLVGGVMAVPGATSIGIRNWNTKNSILFDDIMSQYGIQYSDVDKFSLGLGELLQGNTPTTIESALKPAEARTEGYDRAEQATTPYTQAQRQRDIALSRLGKTTQGDVGTQMAYASVLDQAATWSNEQRLAALAEQESELEIRLAYGDKLDEAQAGLDSAQEGYAQAGESLDSIDSELAELRQRLDDLKALQNAELESPEATQELDRAESKMAEIQTLLDRSTPTEQLPGAKAEAEAAEPVSKQAALQTQLDTAEPVEQVPGQAPETGTADDRRTRLESQGIAAGSVEQFRQELESVDPESPDALERIAEIQKRMDMAGIKRAEKAQIPYHGRDISYKRENIPDIQEHRANNPELNDEAFDFAAETAYSAGLTGSRTLFEVSAAIQDLAPETAKALFDAGLGVYNAKAGERHALRQRMKDYMPKPGQGKLIIPKEVIQKMNPEQKKLAADLQKFIIMAGVEGELFASETADESGRILGEEGSFDPATGRFTFDINAGINFVAELKNKARGAVEFALPRVMGHEFTHYLKTTAPELYAVYQEAVIKELSAKNQLDDLILTELGRARKGALSIGVALEEVVARSSEMMFRDSQALVRAMGENPTLWQKFKAWVTEFVQNIKDRMKGMNPAYAGAKSLIETGDSVTRYVGDLQAKWDKALEQSITERMDAHGLRKTAPISPVTEGEGVTLSPQELGTEGAGIAGNEGAARPGGEQMKFSLRSPMEAVGNLVAVHNLSESQLQETVRLGGFAMPSIAVMKAGTEHSRYGDISVVFGKETIDPVRDPRNKIYGGDAYTPSFPQINYEISGDNTAAVRKKVSELLGELYKPFAIQISDDSIKRAADNNRGSFADAYENEPGLMGAYLKSIGEDFIPYSSEPEYAPWSGIGNQAIKYLADKMGRELQAAYNKPFDEKMAMEPAIRGVINEYFEQQYSDTLSKKQIKEMSAEEYGFNKIDEIIRGVGEYLKTKGAVRFDKYETGKMLRDRFEQDNHLPAYRAWLTELFAGAIAKSGIRNNADIFTPSGNRRSFDATHWQVTLDNIVRAMKAENSKGADGWASSNLFGVATKNFKSIADVRRDADRLRQMDDEAYKAEKNEFQERLVELAGEIAPPSERNRFIALDNAAEVLTEAARKGTTAGIQRVLNGYKDYYNIREDTAKKLYKLMSDISRMPTEYFEAKPERAVGLEEMRAVIHPNTTSKSLIDWMERKGVRRLEYEAGNEQDRLDKLNSVEDVRFSERDIEYLAAVESGDMDTAQEMVDDAAKAAGYTIKAYHGTTNKIEYADKSKVLSPTEKKAYENEEQAILAEYEKNAKPYLAEENYHAPEFVEVKNTMVEKLEALYAKYGQRLGYEKITIPFALEGNSFDPKKSNDVGTHFASKKETSEIFTYNNGIVFSVYLHGNEVIELDDDIFSRYQQARSALDEFYDKGIIDGNDYDSMLLLAQKADAFETEDERDWGFSAPVRSFWKKLNDILIKNKAPIMSYINMVEGGGESYAVVQPAQIKSADPVTYDDAGNVIPLSQRFDTGKTDIRFAERDHDNSLPSARAILAGAFGEVAQTDAEKKRVAEYRKGADCYNRLEGELNALLEKRKQLYRDKAPQSEKNELRADINALRDKLDKADRVLLNLQMSKPLRDVVAREVDKAYQSQNAKSQERQKEYRERVRLRSKEQLAQWKDKYKQKESDRKRITQAKDSIQKLSSDLREAVVTPTAKKHVPESMRGVIGEFLNILNEQSRRSLGGGMDTRADRAFYDKMDALVKAINNIRRMQYQASMDEGGGNEGITGHLDIPDDIALEMEQLVQQVKDIIDAGEGEYVINRMNLEQLESLDKMLRVINSAVRKANALHNVPGYKQTTDLAGATHTFLGNMKSKLHRIGKSDRFLNWSNTEPIYALDRLGPAGKAIAAALIKGMDAQAKNSKRVLDFALETFSEKESREWGKTLHHFTLDGQPVVMNTAQLMSLYLLNKRDQARGHLYGGGFRVETFKVNGKNYADGGHVLLERDVAMMLKELAPDQKKKADALQEFMSTVGAEWGNTVSMARWGFNYFNEENYFPIESARENIEERLESAEGNPLYRLLNLGHTKGLIKGANNQIMLRNVVDVFAAHMTDMAQYNALAMPLLDAIKWYNYQESKKDHETGRKWVTSVRKDMMWAFGDAAPAYMYRLLSDISGARMTGFSGAETYGLTALRRFNRAAVAANVRVALLQPTAFLRAHNVINARHLALGALKNVVQLRKNIREMEKWSGIAIWKQMGFYDINLSRSLLEMIKRDNPLIDRMTEASMKLPQAMDRITWAAIWGGAKNQVAANNPGLDRNSDAFYKKVQELFDDAIYRTQVVDSMLTRSEHMRETNLVSKWTSSFMSEPTKTYNILAGQVHAFTDDIAGGMTRGQAWAKNRAKIGRTMMTYGITVALTSAVEALMGAWRDDDDYKTFWEKFLAELKSNALDNLTPLNWLPIVNDVWQLAKDFLGRSFGVDMWGYEEKSILTAGIQMLFDGTSRIISYIKKPEGKYFYGATYELLRGVSAISGHPFASATREVVDLWNNTAGLIYPEYQIKRFPPAVGDGYDKIYEAMVAGDKEAEKRYRDTVIRNYKGSGDIEKNIGEGLGERIKADYLGGIIGLEEMLTRKAEWAGYTDAQEDIRDAFKAGNIDRKEAERLLKEYAGDKEPKEMFKLLERWETEDEAPDKDGDGTPDFSILDKFYIAVRTGKNLRDVVTEYTDPGKYGYTKSYLSSKLTEKFKQEYIDNPAQRSKLKGYLLNAYTLLGYDREERSGEINRWLMKYDSADFENAIATGVNLKAVIDEKIKYSTAKNPKGVIISQVTATFADQYKKMTPTERAKIKPRLIDAYVMLGYDRAYSSKKIDKWLTD